MLYFLKFYIHIYSLFGLCHFSSCQLNYKSIQCSIYYFLAFSWPFTKIRMRKEDFNSFSYGTSHPIKLTSLQRYLLHLKLICWLCLIIHSIYAVDVNGCEVNRCFVGVECFDIPWYALRPTQREDDYHCGECPGDLRGDGKSCFGKYNSFFWYGYTGLVSFRKKDTY